MTPGRQVLRVLDMFSGTGSIAKAFRDHEVDTLDIDTRFEPTILTNVLDWNYRALPRLFYHVIWASVPC
jgi:hypothetical protein